MDEEEIVVFSFVNNKINNILFLRILKNIHKKTSFIFFQMEIEESNKYVDPLTPIKKEEESNPSSEDLN